MNFKLFYIRVILNNFFEKQIFFLDIFIIKKGPKFQSTKNNDEELRKKNFNMIKSLCKISWNSFSSRCAIHFAKKIILKKGRVVWHFIFCVTLVVRYFSNFNVSALLCKLYIVFVKKSQVVHFSYEKKCGKGNFLWLACEAY